MSQLRCGILPLRIETGRFLNEKYEERICKFCNTSKVEDESHFVFECPFYKTERNAFLLKTDLTHSQFSNISNLNHITNSALNSCILLVLYGRSVNANY